MSGTHIKGPLTVAGVEVIDSEGKITGPTGSIGSDEIDSGVIQVKTVTLGADSIVGTAAGDIGSTGGAVLVAAPGAGKTIEFVSAVLSYHYSTAAYTGGGDDLVIRQGTTTVSPVIAKADLLAASGDKIASVGAANSAADVALTANSTLNLSGTAYTNPGTAAGTLKVIVTYKIVEL